MGKKNNHEGSIRKLDLIFSGDRYKDELNRIDRDNSVEQSLYFMIQLLLRLTIADEYWVTDISKRSKKDVGLTHSVPDLAVIECGKKLSNATAYVEIKYFPWSKREQLSYNQNQVASYFEKVDKVIYTNGIEWEFLDGKDGVITRKERIFLGNDSNPPDSYYERLNKKTLSSQIHWKRESEFKEAWNELIYKLNTFLK